MLHHMLIMCRLPIFSSTHTCLLAACVQPPCPHKTPQHLLPPEGTQQPQWQQAVPCSVLAPYLSLSQPLLDCASIFLTSLPSSVSLLLLTHAILSPHQITPPTTPNRLNQAVTSSRLWLPECAAQQPPLPTAVPTTFTSPQEYLATFTPLLLEEAVESVRASYEECEKKGKGATVTLTQ